MGGVVRSGQAGWRAGSTPGVAIKLLRDDKPSGASTFLLRLDPARGHRVLAGEDRMIDDHPALAERPTKLPAEGEVRRSVAV